MKLPRSFYIRSALVVAPDLLGKIFVRNSDGVVLKGMITEVEAYMGAADPASHAYKGQTPRNTVMFREGGHLYVYFTYGMHYCANVVAGKADYAEAVLLRAVMPLLGMDTMMANRTASGKTIAEKRLTDGPAKLCQAFGIGRSDNGTDLCGSEIYIEDAPSVPRRLIKKSTRIGISMGKEHLWRFFLEPDIAGQLHQHHSF